MINNVVRDCACGTSVCDDEAAFRELDEFIDEHIEREGNLIIILQKAQTLYGYLSKPVVEHISRRTGHTQAKVFGVATFYTQFRLKPIGKNLIMLCQGTACHVSGSKEIERAVCKELDITDGETTADGLFTLNNVACLGCCSLAPVMMIQNEDGEETYGKLTKETVVEILRGIRKGRAEQSA
jgi:NADH-quinone oxidoreductase subunit E